jgi:colicin import membrane protein
LALVLHLLVILALYIGWKFAPQRQWGAPLAGSPMVEASLVISQSDIDAANEAVRNSPKPDEDLPQAIAEEDTRTMPQPLPESRPQDAVTPQQSRPQDFVAQPDTVDQAHATRDSVSPETAAREQEERRRQSQVDLTAEQRQQEAQNNQRLAKQQQEERERRIAEARRQREEAARQTDLAAQRVQQLRDAARQNETTTSVTGTPGAGGGGQGGVSDDLTSKYIQEIQRRVQREWTRPGSIPLGQRCTVKIRQIVGGEVINVTVSPDCPYDEQGRRSLEAAIIRAQPLPYAGFQSVFKPDLNFHFEARDP